MTDKSPHSNESRSQPLSDTEAAVNTSRRRLTGAGLGMSAVFTLASRPVLAANCVSASAAASGNLSHHGVAPSCTGKSVTYWAANCKLKDNFNNIFVKGSKADWESKKIREVLQASDNGNTTLKPNPISKEFAAALLNIRAGYIPSTVLDEGKLIGMWNDWVADGEFNPKAGATWYATQIVLYLQGLQS